MVWPGVGAGAARDRAGWAQEGPARGPWPPARRWFWDGSPTPQAASAGCPVPPPNLPEAQLHPDTEGVSDPWSGPPPGSGFVCSSVCLETKVGAAPGEAVFTDPTRKLNHEVNRHRSLP